MTAATIEMGDIIRQFRDQYVAAYGEQMMPSQNKALHDIAACCTSDLGGHRYRCQQCDAEFWVYHACRNRSCPKCHGRQMQLWFQQRQAELLPCGYYHLVATVPEELRPLFLSEQKYMYGLLMKTVARAVIDLASERKRLGALPGILMVLHTWNGQMMYHPHVHLLVTQGGVTDDRRQWRTTPTKFLVPVKALSRVIAARIRDALKKERPELFERLPSVIWRRPWCSFCKHYGNGEEAVLRYLARYVFRIAITNARIVDMDDTHVTFQYKDRDANRWRTCRLSGVEFLRRFLMHVLPRGFHKVRYYGLWHHSKRNLQRCAYLLLMLDPTSRRKRPPTFADLTAEAIRIATNSFTGDEDVSAEHFQPTCPHCRGNDVVVLEELQRARSP